MGGITVTHRLKIAKIVPFRYPRSWNSSNDISSKTISQIALKLYGRHWSDIEIQNAKIVPFQYPWRPSWNSSNNVCVEVLRPSQPKGVMSSVVSLPNHTFTGQALSSKRLTNIVDILSPETDKWYLLQNRKFDWVKTWWEASVSSFSFLFLFLPCPSLWSPLLSLLSLFSLSLGDDTKWPTRVDMSLNPNTINQWWEASLWHHSEIQNC